MPATPQVSGRGCGRRGKYACGGAWCLTGEVINVDTAQGISAAAPGFASFAGVMPFFPADAAFADQLFATKI
jgi:hypothetical protein